MAETFSPPTYDIAAEKAEQSFERWLDTISATAIAIALERRWRDVSPELADVIGIGTAAEAAVGKIVGDEALGNLGWELNCNLSLEEFRAAEEIEEELRATSGY